MDQETEELALLRAIVGSESFMWLVTEAGDEKWIGSHCRTLYPAYCKWRDRFPGHAYGDTPSERR